MTWTPIYEDYQWFGLITSSAGVTGVALVDVWVVLVGSFGAGSVKPVLQLNIMRAVVVRSEQAVGRCLRAHTSPQAEWLWLCSPWRKGEVRGQTGGKKRAVFC